jgi:predicted Zn-dependent protease
MNARRGFLQSACRWCAGLGGLGFTRLAASQDLATADLPPRFTRPPVDSDEGGLWAMMDREEQRLRRSPFVVRDDRLTRYLEGVVCRLGADHCIDVRVHVVRNPLFNASMAPNGMMQVWSGLLLRMENEAQLAAVLGHELGHYLERHSVERLRDSKSRAAFAQLMGVFGIAGTVAQWGIMAGMFSFTRDQEARADRLGLALMQRAGYDPAQAARVWDNLLGELKVTGGEEAGTRSPLFATHPPAANRRDELLRQAGSRGGEAAEPGLRQVLAPHRLAWLEAEVRRGQWEESLVLLDRMIARDPLDAQACFARGEVYRQRYGEGDLARALDDLVAATALPGPPVQAFRSLGLLRQRLGDKPGAVAAFQRYLARAPEAMDAGLIRSYLAEMAP